MFSIGSRFIMLLSIAAVVHSAPVGGDVAIDYDDSLARKYMIHASATYCYEEHGRYNLSEWRLSDQCLSQSRGFRIVKEFFDYSFDAFAYVGISDEDKLIVVAVKGTTPNHLRDWYVDFTGHFFVFDHTCDFEFGIIGTHKGFCNVFMRLKEMELIKLVQTLVQDHPSYKVVVSGHSLGGALASFIAFDLLALDIRLSLYTYGQPRSGTGELANKFKEHLLRTGSEYFRITHNQDPVSHVPFCTTDELNECISDDLHPFHSGVEVHYPSNMDEPYVICPFVDGDECTVNYPININDHRYFFDVEVAEACCPPPEPEPSDEYEPFGPFASSPETISDEQVERRQDMQVEFDWVKFDEAVRRHMNEELGGVEYADT